MRKAGGRPQGTAGLGVAIVAEDVGGSTGMGRQLGRLVEGLLARGHRVTVTARTCTVPTHRGLRWLRVPTPSRPFAIAYPLFAAVAGIQLTRARDIDLVHTTGAIVPNRVHLTTVHYCHAGARRLIGPGRASRAQMHYRANQRIAIAASLAGERWCYRPERTQWACGVSEGVTREIREHYPRMAGRLSVIPNGVDMARFRPDPAARRRVRVRLGLPDGMLLGLFVGGDWERKGLRAALEGIARRPAWRLLVAGKGDEGRWQSTANELGASARVTFLGHVSDIAELYAAADALVFPTVYEAFPLTALEAASAGLPLLATPVHGVEELLEDGVNGFFIGGDGRSVAAGLERLEDGDRRKVMGRAARSAAERYGWERVVDRYVELYRTLLSEWPPLATSPAIGVEPGRRRSAR